MSQARLCAGFWLMERSTGNVYSALTHLLISVSVLHTSLCHPLVLLPLLERELSVPGIQGRTDAPCKLQSVLSFAFNVGKKGKMSGGGVR